MKTQKFVKPNHIISYPKLIQISETKIQSLNIYQYIFSFIFIKFDIIAKHMTTIKYMKTTQPLFLSNIKQSSCYKISQNFSDL